MPDTGWLSRRRRRTTLSALFWAGAASVTLTVEPAKRSTSAAGGGGAGRTVADGVPLLVTPGVSITRRLPPALGSTFWSALSAERLTLTREMISAPAPTARPTTNSTTKTSVRPA
jgi:hypothetical protein